MTIRVIDSPFGPMTAGATAKGLAILEFPGVRTDRARAALEADLTDHAEVLDRTELQLAAYFAGDLAEFDLPLDLRGTDFDIAVWRQLLQIPAGQTRSYADLARALGKPGASRAVGLANGRNRLAIVIPCHRVIGADGTLTGYGGGLERKRWLLRHEGALAPEPSLFA